MMRESAARLTQMLAKDSKDEDARVDGFHWQQTTTDRSIKRLATKLGGRISRPRLTYGSELGGARRGCGVVDGRQECTFARSHQRPAAVGRWSVIWSRRGCVDGGVGERLGR